MITSPIGPSRIEMHLNGLWVYFLKRDMSGTVRRGDPQVEFTTGKRVQNP